MAHSQAVSLTPVSPEVIPTPGSRRLLFGGHCPPHVLCPLQVEEDLSPSWAARGLFSLTPDSYLLCCCSLEPLGSTGHCFKIPGHTQILGPMSPAGSKPQTTTLGQREHGGTEYGSLVVLLAARPQMWLQVPSCIFGTLGHRH